MSKHFPRLTPVVPADLVACDVSHGHEVGSQWGLDERAQWTENIVESSNFERKREAESGRVRDNVTLFYFEESHGFQNGNILLYPPNLLLPFNI